MAKTLILLASVNGFLAVSLGAFAAHGLRARLDADMLNTFQTGVQYQMYHALALFGIGLLSLQFPASTILRNSGFLIMAGIVIFSGSLYVLSLSGIRWLGAITPIGGVAFLCGWGLLAWFAVTESFSS